MKFIYPAVFKKTEDGRYKGDVYKRQVLIEI